MEQSQEELTSQDKVVFKIIVGRHGEKGDRGQLLDSDTKPFELGQKLGPVTKSYSGPVPRARQTAERISQGANEGQTDNQRYHTRERYELSSFTLLPEEFIQVFKNDYEQGFDRVLADDKACAIVASGLAARLDLFRRMSDRVNPDESVNLPQITHDLDIACLLKQALLRKIDGQEVRGFENIEEIGGPFEPNEYFEFHLKQDGAIPKVSLTFSDPERSALIGDSELDMNKVAELNKVYQERVKALYL
jgi:hypothetical protein